MDMNAGKSIEKSDSEYIQLFNKFFSNKRRMTATYKAIVLKSLLDLGQYNVHGSNSKLVGEQWVEETNDDTIILDLNFIAARFIKYYWDLEHSFKLKQATNSTAATIITIIKDESTVKRYKKPPTFHDLANNTNKEMRDKVIKLLNKQALHSLVVTDMPGLYRRLDDKNKIMVHRNLIPFLKKHNSIIKHGLNHVLSKFLDKHNPSTPRISLKVDTDEHPSRILKPAIASILEDEQGSECFYCERDYKEHKIDRHIDHVIPFDFIYSTDAFNCVASCQKCNCIKSNNLPEKIDFCRVIKRNDGFKSRVNKFDSLLNDLSQNEQKWFKLMQPSFATYDKEWYDQTYKNCKVDYHGNDAFFIPIKYVP